MVQHLYARSFMLMILGSLLSFGWVMAQEEPPDEPDEAVVPIFDLTGSDASEPAEPQETVPVVPIVPVQVLPTPPPGAMQPFSLADSLLQATTCPDRLANSPVVVSTFTQLDQAVACANASTTPYIIYLADQTSTFQFTHTLSVTGHVEIYGRGATLSVLDGMGANRLFSVAGQLLLSHVTLRNAKPPINYGGAMRNSGHLTLQDSVMTGNHVRHGGGAILSTGTLTIERTHFVNNRAGGGAGIQMSGTATLSCVLFQGNTHHATQVRDYASALLVHNDGTATIRHSTFANPTTDEISTQDAAQVDARENYWSGRTVPADVNQYGSQVTFGSELSQNPITTNPDCAFKAPIAPLPTATPSLRLVTNTPHPSTPTPQANDPVQLATLFPPPMDPTNLDPVLVARLSNSQLANRGNISPPLCSRDINPFNPTTQQSVSGSGYNLITPADGEVMIIDTSFAGDANAGLGNFVAIRIITTQLPPEIWGRLVDHYAFSEPGYIYVGYAHLQSVSPTITTRFDGTPLPIARGTVLGFSGATGTDNAHLDVTIFYITEASGLPLPRNIGYEGSPPRSQLPYWYNSFYRIFLVDQNTTIFVDPLTLWPILAEDLATDYDSLIAQVCS